MPKFDSTMAKKKSTKELTKSKPFSFYGKELKQTDKKPFWKEEDPEPFKANVVPWSIQVPLYKRMLEKDSQERELRIRERADKL